MSEAGLSDPLIDAVWPTWWSDEAFPSDSAKAELRFSIARKLGLSATSLLHDEVQFAWKDEARFKNLSNETDGEKAALTSFGMSVARLLIGAIRSDAELHTSQALDVRNAILKGKQFVDLQSLIATCWSFGIPVIHLRLFPLIAKRMHAMAVNVAGRHAILLGRDARYPAPIAFTLAHEIGHVMLGHVTAQSPIIDVGAPWQSEIRDREEEEADGYALELLLGDRNLDIQTSSRRFSARQLADSALTEGPPRRVEPGTLALCLGYKQKKWAIANNSLTYIYSEEKPVWQQVNGIAAHQLNFTEINDDSADYLRKVIGINDG